MTSPNESDATATGKPNKRRTSFLTLLKEHPLATLGSVASIIGIPLTIYYASPDVSELTYAVQPTRTAVVRPGEVSNLRVEFKGKVLTGDVTAAQVGIWNAVRRPSEWAAPFARTRSTGSAATSSVTEHPARGTSFALS